MAKPVFIVCAESMSLDKSTNHLSLFHILEGYTLSEPRLGGDERGEGPIPAVAPISLDFIGIATWAREERDTVETEYDFVVQVSVPWEEEWRTVNEGRMSFSRPFYRFIARMVL